MTEDTASNFKMSSSRLKSLWRNPLNRLLYQLFCGELLPVVASQTMRTND